MQMTFDVSYRVIYDLIAVSKRLMMKIKIWNMVRSASYVAQRPGIAKM